MKSTLISRFPWPYWHLFGSLLGLKTCTSKKPVIYFTEGAFHVNVSLGKLLECLLKVLLHTALPVREDCFDDGRFRNGSAVSLIAQKDQRCFPRDKIPRDLEPKMIMAPGPYWIIKH